MAGWHTAGYLLGAPAASAVGPAWLRVLALEAETALAEAGPAAQVLLRLRAEALE